jgi:transglutaminase-like putative cysteine protease
MIDAVRSLGLAARFVSGYIFVPDTAATNAVGGAATHAWLQVYLPGAGWVDFDPTNCIIHRYAGGCDCHRRAAWQYRDHL